jgi:hypothetical protein
MTMETLCAMTKRFRIFHEHRSGSVSCFNASTEAVKVSNFRMAGDFRETNVLHSGCHGGSDVGRISEVVIDPEVLRFNSEWCVRVNRSH